jgi:hypothetical protein
MHKLLNDSSKILKYLDLNPNEVERWVDKDTNCDMSYEWFFSLKNKKNFFFNFLIK